MKKRANLSFTVMIALLVVCCGAALLAVAGSSKYNSKSEYERIEARYIAESGVDTSAGLFINYLANRDFALTYTQNEGGGYSVITDYSPYLLDEIKNSKSLDEAEINIVANECKDYLETVGFLDFLKEGSVKVCVNTYGDKESFKVTQMCTQPDFLISDDSEETENKRSRLKPVFLTVKAKYKGGEVTANIKISGLYAVRQPFIYTDVGEKGSVPAWIDTSSAVIEYENYQNYRKN